MNYADLKTKNLQRQYAGILAQETIATYLPTTLQIEPTNRCNLACLQCPRNYWDAQANALGDISQETLAHVTGILPTVDRLVLGGIGEPTSSPRLRDIVLLGREYACKVQIITNGTLLTDKLLAFFEKHPPYDITISLDGHSDETYQKIRGVLASTIWPKLKELGSIPCRKTIHTVVLASNAMELPDIVSSAAEYRASELIFIMPKIYSPALAKESPFAGGIDYATIFAECQRRAERLGLPLRLPALELGIVSSCRQPFEMLFVRHNGEVYGCCSALFSNPHYSLRLGHVKSHSLEELWNNPQMQAFRAAYFGRQTHGKPCNTCAFRINTESAFTRTSLAMVAG